MFYSTFQGVHIHSVKFIHKLIIVNKCVALGDNLIRARQQNLHWAAVGSTEFYGSQPFGGGLIAANPGVLGAYTLSGA